MTLVVAGAEDGTITLVADTKITWEDDAIKTASIFEEALTKIVLLRDDLAVGLAGEFPDRVIKSMMKVRHRPLDQVLEALREDDRCDFLVASLEPLSIWRVARGRVEEYDLSYRTHIGDPDAFSRFQYLYDGWIPGDPQVEKMRTSMDQITSILGPSPFVGGFATTVNNRSGAFRFQPREFAVAGNTQFDGFHGLQLPGADPTPGASAIYIPRAKVGRVFRHEDPSSGVKVRADTVEKFAAAAHDDLGQTLMYWEPSPPPWL